MLVIDIQNNKNQVSMNINLSDDATDYYCFVLFAMRRPPKTSSTSKKQQQANSSTEEMCKQANTFS